MKKMCTIYCPCNLVFLFSFDPEVFLYHVGQICVMLAFTATGYYQKNNRCRGKIEPVELRLLSLVFRETKSF